MIVLYIKENNRYLQAIPGFPKYMEQDNKLYIEIAGKMVVAVNDLSKVGYSIFPDQEINVPVRWVDGEPEEIPCTVQELNLRELEANDLPCSQHLARIKEVDVQKPKPVVVTRDAFGKSFDIPCVVTQDIKEQYQAGNIQVGDIVIVSYCEERPEAAMVQSKIYKSW